MQKKPGWENLTKYPISGLAGRCKALLHACNVSLLRWVVVWKVELVKWSYMFMICVVYGCYTGCVFWAPHVGILFFSELAAQLSASCLGEFLPPVPTLFALGALVSSHSACLQTKTTSREWALIKIEMLSYCTGSWCDWAALYTSVWALWDRLCCCLNKINFWLVYWKALPTLKALFCTQIIKKLAGGCVWSLIQSIAFLHS